MTEELQGATAEPVQADKAPQWLQALLDNQNQQTKQLQMMLAPVLTHISRNPVTHQALPPFAAPTVDGEDSAQRSTLHSLVAEPGDVPSAPWGMSARPSSHSSGPFASELNVINQRARSSGPPRLNLNSKPVVRRRDGRNSEREGQHTFPYQDGQRLNSLAHSGQQFMQDVRRPKLAIYDGKEDWDAFLLPFERLARKYGWTAPERVDRLLECLRGAAIRYVCSLPERIREDYVLLVEQLTQRFGLKDPPTTVRRKLGELRQGKETTAEFAEEVRRLVTFAYPGVDLQLQDQLATDAFLKGL